MSDIWHEVCETCHPDLDLAICGTRIEFDPESAISVEDEEGQDCVVCSQMACVTCPDPMDDEPTIIGRIL